MYIPYWLRKLGKEVYETLYKIETTNKIKYNELIDKIASIDFFGRYSLLELGACPHFARTWIRKETALATLDLLVCGQIVFSFDEFINIFVKRTVLE